MLNTVLLAHILYQDFLTTISLIRFCRNLDPDFSVPGSESQIRIRTKGSGSETLVKYRTLQLNVWKIWKHLSDYSLVGRLTL